MTENISCVIGLIREILDRESRDKILENDNLIRELLIMFIFDEF